MVTKDGIELIREAANRLFMTGFSADETCHDKLRTLADQMEAQMKAQPVDAVAEVIECGNLYAEIKFTDAGFGRFKAGDKLYTKPFPTSAPAGVPEWISVADRLPEEHTRVLVYRGKSEQGYPMIEMTCRYNRDWILGSNHYPPTHWMPLPSAPSPAQGEKE